MLKQIQGLHHVTSMASSAARNNDFFTRDLGLRRVKKTVNFDQPDVYHLYYGDELGTPGSVMTYFPFPDIAPGARGTGEAGIVNFSVPQGSLEYWQERLLRLGVRGLAKSEEFGEQRLHFTGPDGDSLALIESPDDNRVPWRTADVPEDVAIRGFHSTTMRVSAMDALQELLGFMNYEHVDTRDGIVRMAVNDGNGAHILELQDTAEDQHATQGAGSVHHVAFAVANRDEQLAVRKALVDTGYSVTPVIDRDYFWAIYFRSPGGILFEIATNEPGFDRDEDTAHLGEALKLPNQHEHLRPMLEARLEPI